MALKMLVKNSRQYWKGTPERVEDGDADHQTESPESTARLRRRACAPAHVLARAPGRCRPAWNGWQRADPAQRQPPAAPRAEARDGLVAVLRAGRLVPAAAHQPEERADGHPVHPDQQEAEAGHRRAWAGRVIAPLSAVERRPALSARSRTREHGGLDRGRAARRSGSPAASAPATITRSRPASPPSRGGPPRAGGGGAGCGAPPSAARPARSRRGRRRGRWRRAARARPAEEARTPSGTDGGKATSPTQAMSRDHRVGAGVRRLRPLRRRALSTWRPPGVDMRMRNPWVLRRYFFLGW